MSLMYIAIWTIIRILEVYVVQGVRYLVVGRMELELNRS